MDKNLDLFADDHESLGQLVDRLDQIPAAELTAKWGVVSQIDAA